MVSDVGRPKVSSTDAVEFEVARRLQDATCRHASAPTTARHPKKTASANVRECRRRGCGRWAGSCNRLTPAKHHHHHLLIVRGSKTETGEAHGYRPRGGKSPITSRSGAQHGRQGRWRDRELVEPPQHPAFFGPKTPPGGVGSCRVGLRAGSRKRRHVATRSGASSLVARVRISRTRQNIWPEKLDNACGSIASGSGEGFAYDDASKVVASPARRLPLPCKRDPASIALAAGLHGMGEFEARFS
ncbi:hypothetical protein LX32DRAFT_135862 [Colletotrichum zoysiae]|uniref:Uncharacterized protein n=1 Tax=Colletotrichum zoysiae TaxID=1216348 RepID=A0AAD9LZC4_9PEZI|nr:hypothetical protein LX32DRAFT_135862 [Colletotrichum zoysiae]